ncbi:unnamed protein product [Adineta ricciae]|uniref:Uncharacterized protein n=1 Tax=Adineta ricciae TaxID=249248 RepID=A0A816DJV1_ADIRI|nr:unnamed protein product [Adineta ricciae]CAF1635167.1 unnamed protein product [Adineta ricciae]
MIFLGRVISSTIKDSNLVMGYAQMTMEVEEAIKGTNIGHLIVIRSYLQGSMCVDLEFFQNKQDFQKDIEILRNLASQERLNVKERNITKENENNIDQNLDSYYDEDSIEPSSVDVHKEYIYITIEDIPKGIGTRL